MNVTFAVWSPITEVLPNAPQPQLIIDYPGIISWNPVAGSLDCESLQLQVIASMEILGQIQNDPTYAETVRLIQ